MSPGAAPGGSGLAVPRVRLGRLYSQPWAGPGGGGSQATPLGPPGRSAARRVQDPGGGGHLEWVQRPVWMPHQPGASGHCCLSSSGMISVPVEFPGPCPGPSL